ncbi:glyoxalase [Ornithinibacillus sp. L9]|uniref:Glyoxalase n=1 Tax=Ornithinibacillus caprae TaxID=2678566 RepID=A0A6N8FHB5_9BACI|nr:VOC family protein [Ornithinibacillus caprae]MUK88835.1 glyoxalase [Ornithinibacillus caprae]
MEFEYDRIDHVQLAAPIGGEQKARDFYQHILGFKEVEKPDTLRRRGGVWFQAGTVHLHIGVEEPFTPAKKAHPAIHVKNIEGLKKYLAKMGVSFLNDTNLPGANRFYVTDPFGNRLEFLEWE